LPWLTLPVYSQVGFYHGFSPPEKLQGENHGHYLRRKAVLEEEDAKKRRTVQLDFKKRVIDVVVATDAFGMGIDHSNIRRVDLIGSPKVVETLINQWGRGGRDVRSSHGDCNRTALMSHAILLQDATRRRAVGLV
jgi:superfamily II DNA or RNA helicase